MFNVYQDKLSVLKTNVPYRILSKKEQKLKLKPWITKNILISIRKKNELYENT